MLNMSALKALLHCTSNDATRLYLRGVHVQIVEKGGKEYVRYQATNGHKAIQAYERLYADFPDAEESYAYMKSQEDGIIISREFIKRLPAAPKEAKREANYIKFGANASLAGDYGWTAEKTFRVNGTFPNVNAVIPDGKTEKTDFIGIDYAQLNHLGKSIAEASRALNCGVSRSGLILNFYGVEKPVVIETAHGVNYFDDHIIGVLMPMRVKFNPNKVISCGGKGHA